MTDNKPVVYDGRVLALRMFSCPTVDQAREVAKNVAEALGQISNLALATVDFRFSQVFPPEVTNVFVNILKSDNPRIERSAHLVTGSATLAMQIERVVREADNPARKVFREPAEAEAYLGGLLTPAQRTWLHQWYAFAG